MPRIKAATPNDLRGLPALEAAADRLLQTALGCQPLPAAESPTPVGLVLYLVAGTPPAGFARIDEVDGQAHLEQLSVHPDFAGRGIGRSLVQAALDAARCRGYESMTLCTFADVPFNAPFYASCGLVPGLRRIASRRTPSTTCSMRASTASNTGPAGIPH